MKIYLLLLLPLAVHAAAPPLYDAYADNVIRPSPGAPKKFEDETLNFLSTTLGSHMVLQRAPQQAVVWGFTAPGASVTTTMQPSDSMACRSHPLLEQKLCALNNLTTVAAADGTWRQKLPATAASKVAFDFTFASSSSSSERAQMTDVLFGDVYICGGQSNMEYAVKALTDSDAEVQLANNFPTIRFFSVGHGHQSQTPLRDLQYVWEPWQVASNTTVAQNWSPGHTMFSTVSAVCWLFGKELSIKLSPTGDVPIGLVSNNWGGTKVEVWTPATAYAACDRSVPSEYPTGGPMYNAMILPYAAGPMAISGFTWYQGEANTENATTASQYACLFPEMIKAWRAAFAAPTMYFGFFQLSTWCSASDPESLPQMRDAQMAAALLPNVGYATNADHGYGCIIHPPNKQPCSKRLADSALALVYGQDVPWQSPSYDTAQVHVAAAPASGSAQVTLEVSLNHVGPSGLHTIYPYNYAPKSSNTLPPMPVDCFGTFNPPQNTSMLTQCAWAGLEVHGMGWFNATVAAQGQKLLLTAVVPATAPVLVGSAYGWGPIPMMSAYDTSSNLPVLPWNISLP